MEIISQFFALFLGALFTLGAISLVVNGYSWRKVLGNIEKNHSVLLLAATFELFIGLLIIFLHPYYGLGWPIIITVIGYAAIIEASILFVLPTWVLEFKKWSIDKANLHSWALISFCLGIILILGFLGII